MKSAFQKTTLAVAYVALSQSPAVAGKNSVAEFDASEAKSLGWRVVDDGVMGGRSKGNIKVSDDGILTFSGKLSLENNGGFSSLRTERLKMNLAEADGLIARVKGDGRTYQMRFNTEARFRGMEVSFKADFKTKKNEWIEVKVPFDQFKGSFRGMSLSKEKFDPGKISRIGLLLGDKKQGPFELKVDWIRSYGGSASGDDIVSAALADGRFGILAKALTEAKLVETLQGKGPFTVFAPTDDAFKKLPKGTVETLLKPENSAKLQDVLTYHVVASSIDLASALSAAEAKTVQGSLVKIAFSEGRVRVNDAAIVNADVQCSNGVIHVIDSVILPPEESEPSNDIASVAKRAGNFTTLLAAVDAVGLTDALTSDQDVTVLAPTDAAFAALPKGTVEELLESENRDKLIAILSLHAIPGKVSAGDALNAGVAKSLGGGSLKFSVVDGLLKVNGATITKTDIKCDNGTIHVIDAVILSASKRDKDKTALTNDKTPLEQIEAAIDRGVPIFNSGEHGECANIYNDCMVSISKASCVDSRVSMVIKQLVKKAENIESDTERAWVLRNGLDHVYATLSSN
tara:strand:- start:1616 stop:3331 length:1716 start_codon:yes stop_codon:yes gene_type:complete